MSPLLVIIAFVLLFLFWTNSGEFFRLQKSGKPSSNGSPKTSSSNVLSSMTPLQQCGCNCGAQLADCYQNCGGNGMCDIACMSNNSSCMSACN